MAAKTSSWNRLRARWREEVGDFSNGLLDRPSGVPAPGSFAELKADLSSMLGQMARASALGRPVPDEVAAQIPTRRTLVALAAAQPLDAFISPGRFLLRGDRWPAGRDVRVAMAAIAAVDIAAAAVYGLRGSNGRSGPHLSTELTVAAQLATRVVAASFGVPPTAMNAPVAELAVDDRSRVVVSIPLVAAAIAAPALLGARHGLLSAERPTAARVLRDLAKVTIFSADRWSHRFSDFSNRAGLRAADAALTEERARIAREMHDVVAHELSVVAVQAGGAGAVLDVDPDRARQAVAEAEAAARRGLVELRRLLGTLRTAEGDASTAPLPGIAALDDVVRASRAAGLDVHATIDAPDLPTGVALNVHRIVQEALTNSLKHAGPTRVDVLVEVVDGAAHVRVADAGPVAAARRVRVESSGNGLVGMRERVDLFEGALVVGPATDGPGWVVDARLAIGS